MSVYSNTDIIHAIQTGIIVSVPFNERHVSEASLDFTLGHNYFVTQQDSSVYNPFDPVDVATYFNEPQQAMRHEDWCKKHGKELFKNIPADHPIIVLGPNERILAHTHEFIGIRAQGGACQVRTRSSWARNGIAICFDAGWIDPGYINRIALQVHNLNMRKSIVLPVGERIGQLIFHKTGPVAGHYASSRSGMSGKYQSTDDLNALIANWKPSDMLPRAFKDARVMPAKIKGLAKGTK